MSYAQPFSVPGTISQEEKSPYTIAMKSPIPGQGYVNSAPPARANILATHSVTGSHFEETTLGASVYKTTHLNNGSQTFVDKNEARKELTKKDLSVPSLVQSLPAEEFRPSMLLPSPPYSYPVPKIEMDGSSKGKKRVRIVGGASTPEQAELPLSTAATRRGVTLRFLTEFEEHYLRNNRSAGRKNMRCFPSCCQLGHKELGFCGGAIELALRLSRNNLKAETIDNSNLRIFIEMRVIPGAENMTPQQYGGLCEANICLNGTYTSRYIESLAKTTKVQTRPLFEAKILPLKVMLQAQQRYQRKMLKLKSASREQKSNDEEDALATLAALASTEPIPKKNTKVQMMKAEKPPIRKKRKFSNQRASNKAYKGPEVRYYVRPRSWHYGWISNKHTHGFLHYVRAYLFEKCGTNGDQLECIEICDSDTFVISSSKRWQQPVEKTDKKRDVNRPTGSKCYPVSTPSHQDGH